MTNSKYEIERGVAIKRDQLLPNEWNPNKTTDRQQAAIGESLQTYGQVLELLVRPHPTEPDKFQIVDGEHRYNALSETVYVNVIHDLSEADAKKLTIVLNETRGKADKVELAQLLADIQVDLGDDLMLGLPYDNGELEELIKLADVNWDNFQSDFDSTPGNEQSHIGSDWVTITVKIPSEAMQVIQDAYNLIEQERGGLHKDEALAWGTVLESLAADYLAMPETKKLATGRDTSGVVVGGLT